MCVWFKCQHWNKAMAIQYRWLYGLYIKYLAQRFQSRHTAGDDQVDMLTKLNNDLAGIERGLTWDIIQTFKGENKRKQFQQGMRNRRIFGINLSFLSWKCYFIVRGTFESSFTGTWRYLSQTSLKNHTPRPQGWQRTPAASDLLVTQQSDIDWGKKSLRSKSTSPVQNFDFARPSLINYGQIK